MSNSNPPQPDITRTIEEILDVFYEEMSEADDPDEYFNNQERFKALAVIIDEVVQKLVTLLNSELNQAKAEWLKEVIGKVPGKQYEIVSDNDYTFIKGYNQCREDILRALGELK